MSSSKCWGCCPGVLSAPSAFQVSRFLVVRPESRCTAEEALAHPFFQQYVVEEVRHFSPRGKFKVGGPRHTPVPTLPPSSSARTAGKAEATGWLPLDPADAGPGGPDQESLGTRPRPLQVIALTVLASVRIYYQYRRVKPVTREIVIRDPYALRPLRRLIDAYAFRIYGHWVKKGQQQNRAALFENTPKAVLLSLAEEEDF